MVTAALIFSTPRPAFRHDVQAPRQPSNPQLVLDKHGVPRRPRPPPNHAGIRVRPRGIVFVYDHACDAQEERCVGADEPAPGRVALGAHQ